jgi:sialic acid synthase SpsE
MLIKIGKNKISKNSKTYFVADIASNYDGSLARAKKLIRLCAKAGADAAKFQHFKAETIVLDEGFKKIGKISHQKKWKKSVHQVYKDASLNINWTKELKKECLKNKIDFLTAPYDLNYVDYVDKYIPAFKIGSGDITWKEILVKIAKKKKPVLIACGASTLKETLNAVQTIRKYNKKIILMHCNTNYTNDPDNLNFINLNALNQFDKIFKGKLILGLSDHTEGHTSVLGAISLGARVIEKHFTDNNNREGPDHKFSLNPSNWKKMVIAARELEKCMGNGYKKLEINEKKSVIVQRRGVWTNKYLKKGTKLKIEDLNFLRPCPKKSISPFEIKKYIGKKLKKNLYKNSLLIKECIT